MANLSVLVTARDESFWLVLIKLKSVFFSESAEAMAAPNFSVQKP